MIKTLSLLLRGTAAQAAEDLVDRNALLLLDQQMRDGAAALGRAQRALAIARAEDAQEARRIEAARLRIADLEARARAALAAGREDLAAEAAATLAELEADADAACQTRSVFEGEVARLRQAIAADTRRFSALQRGRRLARAAEAVRASRGGHPGPASRDAATLSDAEALLARLRAQQNRDAEALELLDEPAGATAPDALERRLADAGFPARAEPTAASVLARLKHA